MPDASQILRPRAGKTPASLNQAAGQDPRRMARLLWWLLLGLWAIQLWRPQLSFPETGVLEVFVAALLLLAAGTLKIGRLLKGPPWRHPAALPGALLILYGWGRWLWADSPAVGAENFGTLVFCAMTATTAWWLLNSSRDSESDPSGPPQLLLGFLAAFCALALLFSLHAAAQYFWLYDQHYDELKRAIGNAEPTPIELGLLYHLKLKRVTSVLGDPNLLGGFLALSLGASLELLFGRHLCLKPLGARLVRCLRALAATSFLASCLGIVLTQSRGAVLDALLVLGAMAVLGFRHWPRPARLGAALLGASLALLAASSSPESPAASPAPASDVLAANAKLPEKKQSMLTRANTIVERLNYLRVGSRILARNPLFGSAPGAVDLYYGRYKPESARETKFLHNWLLQLGVELGAVGVGLALVFLALLYWRAWRARVFSTPGLRCVAVLTTVFVFDALIELTFNSREMMMLFGLLGGAMLFGGESVSEGEKVFRPRAVAAGGAGAFFLLLAGFYLVPALLAANHKVQADLAMQEGDWPQAQSHLRSALFWTPRDPQPYLRLSYVEVQNGATAQDALMLLGKALSLQPESASLHAEMSRLLLETGSVAQARQQIEQALTLYPSNPEYHYQLARVLEKSGDLERACAHARKAIQLAQLYVGRYTSYLEQLEKARKAAPAAK